MTEMKMELPTQMIEDTIRAEMVRSIMASGGHEKMLRAVVKEALEKTDRYDRETVFQKAINKLIRKKAEEAFAEWIEENGEAVKAALIKELNKGRQARIRKIASDITDGLTQITPTVDLKFAKRELEGTW